MKAFTLRAHFDGQHIQLDEPFELERNTPLAVTVLPEEEARDLTWSALSVAGLEAAYGDAEPEYSVDLIVRPNPDYEGG
jgi:threonine/homoserine efflux transporter RhtA